MPTETSAGYAMPAEMRALAEKSVEQARQAFESFLSATQQAFNTAETQAASLRSGAKSVGELAMRFAQQNIASSFDFAQKLARAKDAQEVMSLHAEYANGQISTLSEQVRELSKQAMAGSNRQH